jgi:hypothetical protein
MGILGIRAVLNPGLPALQSPSPAALNAITCSREMPKSRAQGARGPGFTYPQHSQCEYGSNKGYEWTQIKLKKHVPIPKYKFIKTQLTRRHAVQTGASKT